MEESAIKILYDNKDVKCKNSECGHTMESHLHFKNIKEDRIPLIYCSECSANSDIRCVLAPTNVLADLDLKQEQPCCACSQRLFQGTLRI